MLQGRGGQQLHKEPNQALWQPQEGRHGAAGQGSKGQQQRSLGQRQQHKVIGTICRSVAMKKLHRILSDTQHPLNHVLSPRASRRAPLPPPPPKKKKRRRRDVSGPVGPADLGTLSCQRQSDCTTHHCDYSSSFFHLG